MGTQPHTWARGAALGNGEAVASVSARLLSLSREGRRRERRLRVGGRLDLGPWPFFSPHHLLVVSVLSLKSNLKRVAEFERACVTSGGAVA